MTRWWTSSTSWPWQPGGGRRAEAANRHFADVDIRLKLAREAVDDHDYLALLAAQTSPGYARALVRGLIPRDYWDWDPAPEAIYALRDRIGRLLDSGDPVPLSTIQGQVTDAGSGMPLEGVFVTDGESGALTDATGHYTLTVGLLAASTLSPTMDLPVEQVIEALAYYHTHRELIETEMDEEKQHLLSRGVELEPRTVPG